MVITGTGYHYMIPYSSTDYIINMDNLDIVGNILSHLDICGLLINYHSPSPFHHHLRNPNIINMISSSLSLPPVNTFPHLVVEYCNAKVFITHTVYPDNLDQLLKLVIMYKYVDIVDRILTSKLMHFNIGINIYQHLIKYDIHRFMKITHIDDYSVCEIMQYMFTHNTPDDHVRNILRIHDRDYNMVSKHYSRHKTVSESDNNVTSVIRSCDVELWHTYPVTSSDLARHFNGTLCKSICDYMDAVHYRPQTLFRCTDTYSWDWIIDHLQVTLTYKNGDIYAHHTSCNCTYNAMVVGIFGNNSYKTQPVHPQIYLHLLSKCDSAQCQIDLS